MIKKKELEIPSQKNIHRCLDWPELAEQHNWNMGDFESDNEYFRDGMFLNILKTSKEHNYDPYNSDYNSSIDFIKNLEIPKHRKVNLSYKPGCLICHSDLIPDKVHYAIIKGLCDIKTVQYYLFDKGIFFKAWYIKEHIKHINIKDIIEEGELSKPEIIKTLDEQIIKLKEDIKREHDLGESGNKAGLGSMRRLLKEYLDLRSQFKDDNENNTRKSEIDFDELTKLLKQ